jgi:hypothetical protein
VGAFDFSDIKYMRIEDIPIILPKSEQLIYIPPLDAFKEAFIIEQSKKIIAQPLEDPQKEKTRKLINSQIMITVIRTAIGIEVSNGIKEIKDIEFLFNFIISHILKTLSEFDNDVNIHNYMKTKQKGGSNIKKDYNMEFISMILYVQSRISMPEQYAKYCGIRFYLLAYRYLMEQDEVQRISWIPFLFETGLLANCYTDHKKRNSIFETIQNNYHNKYRYDEQIEEIKEMTCEEYIKLKEEEYLREQHWEAMKNNNKDN